MLHFNYFCFSFIYKIPNFRPKLAFSKTGCTDIDLSSSFSQFLCDILFLFLVCLYNELACTERWNDFITCWSEARIWKFSLFCLKFEKLIFRFLDILCAFGFTVGSECYYDPDFFIISTWVSKTKNLMLISNPLKKL
jgi:hypothetical protein